MKLWKLYQKLNAILILIIICNPLYNAKRHSVSFSEKSPNNKSKLLKIIIEKNKKLNLKDESMIIKHSEYHKCSSKKGLITFVKMKPSEKDNTILGTPIYMELNDKALNLFMSFDNFSLFNRIKLENISKIIQPKEFKNTYCFDIIQSYIKETASKKNLLKAPLSLCASSRSDMRNWIDAIEEFKQCKINSIESEGQVLADFNKVNFLMNSLPTDSKQLSMNSLVDKNQRDLMYDNVSSSFRAGPMVDSEHFVSKELDGIEKIIKSSNIEENKIKRILLNKLQTAQNFELQVKNKQNLIQEMIHKQIIDQRAKETHLISMQHKAKEYELLKAVREKIKQMKLEELKDYKTAIINKIKETQSRAGSEADHLMKMMIDHSKLKDFSKCTSPSLFKFNNMQYVRKTCLQYFGEAGLTTCNNKNLFCSLCCSFNVGTEHADKLFNCKSKCSKIINGLETGVQVVQRPKIIKLSNIKKLFN